ncbi:FAD-dependent monooxygenase [Streptomyces erythrochromogenes]|uniref:FAD-dependent oxidoreductase n=1 Tax=Streptomyces erythrochromogenes TaxID=285574 RepID=UPI0034448692
MTTTRPTHVEAVIIGGGYAGLLAAAVISRSGYDVLVLAGQGCLDDPTQAPTAPRAGEVLHVGGIHDVNDLVYQAEAALRARGAHTFPLPGTGTTLQRQHQASSRPWDTRELLTCSHELLTQVLRERVLASPGLARETQIWDGAQAVGLIGDAQVVRGVRLALEDGTEQEVTADLVVDASGAGSLTPTWLKALGHHPAAVSTAGVAGYSATRVYQAPTASADISVTTVIDDARSALLVPVEDGRWLVTQTAPEPEHFADAGAFEKAGLALADPLVGELIATAKPLGEVHISATASPRWYRYELVRSWPRRFVVLGDAAATLPGHTDGLLAAEAGARALRVALGQGILHPTLSRRTQQAVGEEIAGLWPGPDPDQRPGAGLLRQAGVQARRLLRSRQ